jgi:mRNA-degrading endonuclease toxin of MazEF toxin-antitoxin module
MPFLRDGAFIAQSVATYPTVRAIRKLGTLNPAQLTAVETAVFQWLGKT